MVGGVHYRAPGPVGQGRHDPRRPVRRSSLAGDRRGLERAGVTGPRLSVPAARRPVRDARGDAPDQPRDVRGRARHRGGVHGSPVPGRRGCSTRRSRSSRPRVPIMVGGGGEKKTLRLVAQYADACNVFGTPGGDRPQVRDPARALRGGRARSGRDRAIHAPEHRPDPARRGGRESVERRSSSGSATSPMPAPQHIILGMPNADDPRRLELIGRDILPAVRDL